MGAFAYFATFVSFEMTHFCIIVSIFPFRRIEDIRSS